jgi:fermentation-respiration switch protein FrsA (DUF1100 family)
VLLFVGLTAVVVYLLLLGLLWAQQERIVFQPPIVLSSFASHRETPPNVRQVSYRADDGTDLFGFLVGDLNGAERLLLAFHGNADLARNLIAWGQTVAKVTRAAVLLPEIRGYDGVRGRPTYVDAARDARAAHRYATDVLHVPADRIALFGHSLGSAMATELATEHLPTALLLQSPFSSAREMARRMKLPGLALFWPIVSRVHYDTISLVRVLRTPVFVAHGLSDMIVPVNMGRAVYEAAAVKGQLLLVPRAGHNDVAERAPDEYWSWLSAGLRQR